MDIPCSSIFFFNLSGPSQIFKYIFIFIRLIFETGHIVIITRLDLIIVPVFSVHYFFDEFFLKLLMIKFIYLCFSNISFLFPLFVFIFPEFDISFIFFISRMHVIVFIIIFIRLFRLIIIIFPIINTLILRILIFHKPLPISC